MPNTVPFRAFNIVYDRLTNVLITDVTVCPGFSPPSAPDPACTKPFKAIWDTGATNTVITLKVAQDCNLKPISATVVKTANGDRISNVYLTGILLPNNIGFSQVHVTEGTISDGFDVLIGMDIIGAGDFAVSQNNGKTNMSYRVPSVECIDFVQQAGTVKNASPKPWQGKHPLFKNQRR